MSLQRFGLLGVGMMQAFGRRSGHGVKPSASMNAHSCR